MTREEIHAMRADDAKKHIEYIANKYSLFKQCRR